MKKTYFYKKKQERSLIQTQTYFQGSDVNGEIDGRLPLHYASDYGQLEVLKYLCSKVNINSTLSFLSFGKSNLQFHILITKETNE